MSRGKRTDKPGFQTNFVARRRSARQAMGFPTNKGYPWNDGMIRLSEQMAGEKSGLDFRQEDETRFSDVMASEKT